MAWRFAAAAIAVAIVILYAVLSGLWVATDQQWYTSLDQPAWQPPPVVFGLIWPYNFLALIAVGVAMALQADAPRAWAFIGLLAVSIVFALAWAQQFYGPHHLTSAAVLLTLAAIGTLPITVIAFAERWWMGVLLVPYQVWLFLAASLSWGYAATA